MAQTAPTGFQNKKLLLVAIGLGVLFMALYYVQKYSEEAAANASKAYIVRLKTDMEAGQVLTINNVEKAAIPLEFVKNLQGMVLWDDKDKDFEKRLGFDKVVRRVQKSHFLEWTDLVGSDSDADRPSRKISQGWRVISLQVENTRVPGAYLRVGDRVDVYGSIAIKGKPAPTQLIVESLKVMSVGGRIDAQPRQDFRTIDVEVPLKIVPQMLEVQNRVVGRLTVAVRNMDDMTLTYPLAEGNPLQGGTIAKTVAESLADPYMPAPALFSGDSDPSAAPAENPKPAGK